MKTPFSYEMDVNTDDGGTEKVTFTMKDAKGLPVGIIRRNRHSETDLMWAGIEWALTDGTQMDDIDRLSADQFVELSQAWQASGEADQDKPVGPPKTKKTDAE